MSAYLLDTNVLVALLWPGHARHEPAMQWFLTHRARGWATCALTEAGFVRIVSTPAFSRDAVKPSDAVQLLKANTSAKDHIFWSSDIPFNEAAGFCGGRLLGHQQVTDAYLLGLALRKGGLLATLDAGILELTESKSRERKAIELLR